MIDSDNPRMKTGPQNETACEKCNDFNYWAQEREFASKPSVGHGRQTETTHKKDHHVK